MGNLRPVAHKPPEPGCYCVRCEAEREIAAKNRRAAEAVCVNLGKTKPDNPLRSCNGCKAPVYAGKAASHRPDLPIWAWQYNRDKCDWGVEYAEPGSAPAKCPRCRRAA